VAQPLRRGAMKTTGVGTVLASGSAVAGTTGQRKMSSETTTRTPETSSRPAALSCTTRAVGGTAVMLACRLSAAVKSGTVIE